SGRVVDGDNRPRAGLEVRAMLSGTGADGTRRPVQFFMTQRTWASKLEPSARTDADGKFKLDGLMPGLSYVLVVSDDEELARRDGVKPPAPGKTDDVGVLRIK